MIHQIEKCCCCAVLTEFFDYFVNRHYPRVVNVLQILEALLVVFFREGFHAVFGYDYAISSEEGVGGRVPNAYVRVQTAQNQRLHTLPIVQTP